MSSNAKKVLAGFLIGLATLTSLPVLLGWVVMAPLVPGVIFAIFPKTRPMAVGTAIASCVGILMLVGLVIYGGIVDPGSTFEAPQGTVK